MRTIRFCQDDLAGLKQRFHVRQNLGPASRNSLNELRLSVLDRMRDRQPNSIAVGLKLDRAESKALGSQLRPELVPPLQLNPLRLLEFENLPRVRHSSIREDHLPLCSGLPFGFDLHSKPVLL